MLCKNAIFPNKNGVHIKLRVIPGSSQSVFPAGYNKWRNCIEIKVKAKPLENKANHEVICKITEYFNISTKNVFIVSGQKSREKIVAIKNVQIKDIYNKIEESLYGL